MTFEELEDLFYAVKITASPSAFLGFLCGRLTCGAVGIDDLIETSSDWLTLSEEQSEAAQPSLRDFFESSLSNLEDVSFLFQPLLPEDELPLGERLSAVGEWASNYISGLAEGMESNFEVSGEGKEALDDLAAIGQVSLDFETEDEGERDYTELVEYIRIAVQVIFTDLHPELNADLEPTIH